NPAGVRRDFDALEKRRFAAMRLLGEGLNQSEVARRVKVARQTVARWAQQCRSEGKQALKSHAPPTQTHHCLLETGFSLDRMTLYYASVNQLRGFIITLSRYLCGPGAPRKLSAIAGSSKRPFRRTHSSRGCDPTAAEHWWRRSIDSRFRRLRERLH